MKYQDLVDYVKYVKENLPENIYWVGITNHTSRNIIRWEWTTSNDFSKLARHGERVLLVILSTRKQSNEYMKSFNGHSSGSSPKGKIIFRSP